MGAPSGPVWKVTSVVPMSASAAVRRLFGGVDNLDAAGLAPSSGVYLRLDDGLAAKFGGYPGGLVGRVGDPAFGYGDSIPGKDVLGLIFVNLHVGSPCASGGQGISSGRPLSSWVALEVYRIWRGG